MKPQLSGFTEQVLTRRGRRGSTVWFCKKNKISVYHLQQKKVGNFKTIVNKTDIRLEQSISFNTSAVRRQAPIKVIGINSEDQ